MLRRAHDRLGARVALADAERLPVRTGSVDNAYAVWVFHLVRDAAAVLREAARVLRPGGRLLVVTALDQGGDTDVDEVVSRVQLRLQPERSDHSDRLEQLGTDVGFRTGRRARVDSEPHEVTPTGYARAVEQRLYSMYWDLDDEVWRAVVEPALAELRALPDPDRPRQRVVRYDILCFDWDGRP
jgi:SAM-dependent methyltransferase